MGQNPGDTSTNGEGSDSRADPPKLSTMSRTFTVNPLDGFLVIDASSGTVLPASCCYLVADDALPDDAWQAMADDGWTDSDAADAARQYGRRLSDVVTVRPVLPGEP